MKVIDVLSVDLIGDMTPFRGGVTDVEAGTRIDAQPVSVTNCSITEYFVLGLELM
jgi:hypothetical protein